MTYSGSDKSVHLWERFTSMAGKKFRSQTHDNTRYNQFPISSFALYNRCKKLQRLYKKTVTTRGKTIMSKIFRYASKDRF